MTDQAIVRRKSSQPHSKSLFIRESMFLSGKDILYTDTPDTRRLVEQVVCLDITGPVAVRRCQVDR
jgi:hypothetical protein